MQPTFFFHDYESFGLNPALDRPSQFAGIRTDHHFNPIEAPVMYYCQPPADYLPDPISVVLTGITPQYCLSHGLPEPAFAQHIHDIFSVPNTCILGYNNIRYDDEVTRYLFYRNFLDPYAHHYRNNNSRWDLVDLVRATYALRPEGIRWSYDPDTNLPTFKLTALTEANQLSHDNAHDALSDVYATIAVAKLLKQAQPRLFEHFYQHRHKNAFQTLLDYERQTPLVHISGMFGSARGNCSIIAPIAPHPSNKNAVIVLDLMGDISTLIQADAITIHKLLYTPNTALETNQQRIPLKLIHLNKCPILAERRTLPIAQAQKHGIDEKIIAENTRLLSQHRHMLIKKILQVYSQTPAFEKNDVDSMLYSGFFNDEDRFKMQRLSLLPPESLENHGMHFKDARIMPLLFNYRARHYPQTLTQSEQQNWQAHCQTQLIAQLPIFNSRYQAAFTSNLTPQAQVLLQSTHDYVANLCLNAGLDQHILNNLLVKKML